MTFSTDNLLQDIVDFFEKKQPVPQSSRTENKNNSNSFGLNVLSKAKQDLGVHEDLGHNDGKRIREYFSYFNAKTGQEWCAAAVSAWMKEAGGGPVAGSLGARNIGHQFEQAKKWCSKQNITPEVLVPGNIAVWARGGSNSGKGHIGVISTTDGKTRFTSIEGNSGPKGDRVIENSHSINDSNLLGIGILSDYILPQKNSSSTKIEKLLSLSTIYYNFAKNPKMYRK